MIPEEDRPFLQYRARIAQKLSEFTVPVLDSTAEWYYELHQQDEGHIDCRSLNGQNALSFMDAITFSKRDTLIIHDRITDALDTLIDATFHGVKKSKLTKLSGKLQDALYADVFDKHLAAEVTREINNIAENTRTEVLGTQTLGKKVSGQSIAY